jgi:hypothetical protein
MHALMRKAQTRGEALYACVLRGPKGMVHT